MYAIKFCFIQKRNLKISEPKVFFMCSGRNQKVFEMLYEMISETGDEFVFFEDLLRLLDTVVFGGAKSELLLLDYDMHRKSLDFVYNLLELTKLKIPVIMIGGPELSADAQIGRWVSENELRYDIQNLHYLIPRFRKIYSAENSDELKTLMIKSKENSGNFSDLKLRDKPARNFMEAFRKNTDMPPSIYNLLVFLYKRHGKEVSIDEILGHLNETKQSGAFCRESAYSYIARLRKCIKTSPFCDIELMRTRTGYYKLFLR